MEQTVTGGVALLEGVGKFLQRSGPQSADAALVSAAGQALRRYRDRMKQRPLAPAGSFAVGAAALQRRVRDELGLDYTLGQVEALALGEVERMMADFANAQAEQGRAQPMTMLFSSHNLGQVKRLASRVIYLEHGQLVADLPVHDFFNGPLPEAARLFVKGELV